MHPKEIRDSIIELLAALFGLLLIAVAFMPLIAEAGWLNFSESPETTWFDAAAIAYLLFGLWPNAWLTYRLLGWETAGQRLTTARLRREMRLKVRCTMAVAAVGLVAGSFMAATRGSLGSFVFEPWLVWSLLPAATLGNVLAIRAGVLLHGRIKSLDL